MDRRPTLNRLESVPRRPHRLIVIVPILIMLVILGLIYRYAGTRWPGRASESGMVDTSETDRSRRDGSSHLAVRRHNVGATPAAGFHKAEPH